MDAPELDFEAESEAAPVAGAGAGEGPAGEEGAAPRKREGEAAGEEQVAAEGSGRKRRRGGNRSGRVALDEARVTRLRKLLLIVGTGAMTRSAQQDAILSAQLLGLRGALAGDLAEEGYRAAAESALVDAGCALGWKAPVYAALTALLPSDTQRTVLLAARDRARAAALAPGGGGPTSVAARAATRFLVELGNCGVARGRARAALERAAAASGSGAAAAALALPWLCDVRQGDALWAAAEAKAPPHLWAAVSSLAARGAGADDAWAHSSLLLPRPYLLEAVKVELDKAETIDESDEDGWNALADALGSADGEATAAGSEPELFARAGVVAAAHSARRGRPAAQLGPKSGLELAAAAVTTLPRPARWLRALLVEELLAAYDPFVPEAVDALVEVGLGGALPPAQGQAQARAAAEADHDSLVHALFESVLVAAARAPGAGRRGAYYARVLLALMERLGSRGADAAEDAADAAMVLAPSLDAPLQDAIADWFSLWITARGGRWPWVKWVTVVASSGAGSGGGNEDDAARSLRLAWLRRLVERCSETVSRDALVHELPEEIVKSAVFPPAPQPDAELLKAAREAAIGGRLAKEVQEQLVSTSSTPEEVREWLQPVLAAAGDKDEAAALFVLDCALMAGQSGPSDTEAALRKALPALLAIRAPGPALLSRTLDYWWTTSPARACITAAALVDLGLARPAELAAALVKPTRLARWQSLEALRLLVEAPQAVAPPVSPDVRVGAFGAALPPVHEYAASAGKHEGEAVREVLQSAARAADAGTHARLLRLVAFSKHLQAAEQAPTQTEF